MTVEAAWAALAPILPTIGVTRLAEIGRLDRIGLPVYAAIRPNGRSLSVFQGKGLTPDAARVSAAMEALETWCAERVSVPSFYATIAEMASGSYDLIDVPGLAFSASGAFDPAHRLLWVEGQTLDGAARWLPHECVSADYTLPRPPGAGAFVATTNGMGAGLSRDWALRHALLEVIERDAATLWTLGGVQVRLASRLDLTALGEGAARALVDRIVEAGFDLAAWDLTSDVGIPTVRAMIVDRTAEGPPPEVGTAADLSPQRALVGAILEAAQARCTYIAGTREDITAEDYAPEARRARWALGRDLLNEGRGGRPPLPEPPAQDIGGQLAALRTALFRAGLPPPVLVDLSPARTPLHVIRVVAPGLEAAYEGDHGDYTPGARARALLGLAA